MKIPVGPSLEENVKAMESTIRAEKNSTFPKTVQLVFQLSGLLGIPTMLRSLPPMQLFFSPIQGPREPLYINGVAVSGSYFQMNLIAYIRKYHIVYFKVKGRSAKGNSEVGFKVKRLDANLCGLMK